MFLFDKLFRLFRRSDTRSKRIAFIAASSYAGRFGQGAVLLATLPMVKSALSPELFGVWMMLSAMVSFMSFADFGIGNSVLNIATRAHATSNNEQLNQAILSSYLITSLICLFVLLTCIVWFRLSNNPTVIIGAIQQQDKPEVEQSLFLFMLLCGLNIPASMVLRLQLGVQQGYLNGLNQLLTAAISFMLIHVSLSYGGSVGELVLSSLGVQVLVNIANTLVWLRGKEIFTKYNVKKASNAKAYKPLITNGGMFLLLQISAVIAFQSDALVITHILGPTVYGDFAVVQKLFQLISLAVGCAAAGLWPAFGEAIALNNLRWAKSTLISASLVVAGIAVVAVILLIYFMPWVMATWLRSNEMPTFGLLVAFAIWTVIDAVAVIVGAFLNAASILKPQVILALGMAAVAISLKMSLTPIFGATGAVSATILSYLLVCVIGYTYILHRYFSRYS